MNKLFLRAADQHHRQVELKNQYAWGCQCCKQIFVMRQICHASLSDLKRVR